MTANVGVLTRERHRRALLHAIKAMESSRLELQTVPTRVEIASAELRSAIRALESLVGQVDVENLLDEIFASFCIGK
jgi:tRNA modification GTPase